MQIIFFALADIPQKLIYHNNPETRNTQVRL